MIIDLGSRGCWDVDPADSRAAQILRRLADVMQLDRVGRPPAGQRCSDRLRVFGDNDALKVEAGATGIGFEFSPQSLAATERRSTFFGEVQLFQLLALSLVIGTQCQRESGTLLHGALAANDDCGVLLLGPSGRGKTTASRRIEQPWESLSDDMALVIPGADGGWRAHPWPTWSSFMNGGRGGSWDVQRSVDLSGIFFMSWADEDRAERIGSGQAACLLVDAFRQSWWAGDILFPSPTMKEVRTQAFENIASLAVAVPAFVLHMSSHGPFWKRIEEVIDDVRCPA